MVFLRDVYAEMEESRESERVIGAIPSPTNRAASSLLSEPSVDLHASVQSVVNVLRSFARVHGATTTSARDSFRFEDYRGRIPNSGANERDRRSCATRISIELARDERNLHF